MTNLIFCLLTFIGTLLFLVGIPEFFRTILILFWTTLQFVRLSTLFMQFRNDCNISLLSNGNYPSFVFHRSLSPNSTIVSRNFVTLY